MIDVADPSARRADFEPFFFGEASRQLFGIYHAPAGPQRRGGAVVLCYPFGQEYLRCHRSFRQLAIQTARAGLAVLRFDYYGCGDSAGDREDGTLRQWLNDVSTAVAEIRRRARTGPVVLAGLRLGASLAALAAAERGDIEGVALWDPIVDGTAYLGELAAARTGLRVTAGRAASGAATEPTEIQGFPLTPTLAADFRRLTLERLARRPAPRVLLVDDREPRAALSLAPGLEHLGARVDVKHLPGFPIWIEEHKGLVPSATLQSITAWALEVFA